MAAEGLSEGMVTDPDLNDSQTRANVKVLRCRNLIGMFKEFREKQVDGFLTLILEDKPPKIFSLSFAYSRLVFKVKRFTVHFITSPS